MAAIKTEMDILRMKHTWDLVKLLTGANIMDLMWIHNIKWDREGNHIKDKARLVKKGVYTTIGN